MSGLISGLAKQAAKSGAEAAGNYASKKSKELRRKAIKSAARRVLFERQPSDEFSDRLQTLQKNYRDLEHSIAKMNKKIDKLEKKRALTLPINLSRRKELKEDIQDILWCEYAVYDYLSLLFDLVDSPRKMSREELRFYNTCGSYIDKISEGSGVGGFISKVVFLRNASSYVYYRHGSEINRCKRCDMTGILAELNNRY